MSATPNIEPLAVGVKDACRLSGLSRPTLYRAAQRGDLRFRKVGGRTLIMMADLRAFVAGEAA